MKKEVDPSDALEPAIYEHFTKELGFASFTPVQTHAISSFLNKYDCIVQAPTGSGKTLAYVLPLVHILNAKRQPIEEGRCQVLAVVLAPSRELVAQISGVVRPLAEKFEYNVIKLIGGGGVKATKSKSFKKQCIVVATPTRLDHLLTGAPELKAHFRALEMLIVDEADRFADEEFQTSVSSILSCMPKQRQTGLFSATQAKAVEKLLKFGLRNPMRMTVSREGEVTLGESLDEAKQEQKAADVAPKELENFYVCVEAEQKLLALVKFLRANKTAKVLIFVCSSSSVDYFNDILPRLLKNDKRALLAVHGRKQAKRIKIVEAFRRTKSAILVCTDMMARGLDIMDIDWVVQYDIPKQSAWFVHRSGRTARSGHAGCAIVFLTSEESAYIDFIQNYERITLKPYAIDGLSQESALVLRDRIRQIATTDRRILINGTRAFVAFVEAYIKHDCQIICKLKDQNIVGIATSFGLHKLPRMKELRGRADAKEFDASDVVTSEIAYKNEKAEAQRLETREKEKKAKIAEREQRLARLSQREAAATKRKASRPADAAAGAKQDEATKAKRPKKAARRDDWREFQDDERLLKKHRKGKLTKAELNEQL